MSDKTIKQRIVLPTSKQEPSKRFNSQKFLTLGPAGCGKSDFWAQEEKSLFIDTEGNIGHLRLFKVTCQSWQDFRELEEALANTGNPGEKYSVIVIDTLDRWLAQADEEVIRRANAKYSRAIKKGLEINTIGDVPDGNGWYIRQNLVINALNKLHQLGLAVSLIGHTIQREIKEPTRKLDRWTINIGGQLGSQLLGWSNHTLNIEASRNGDKLLRTVHTLPKDTREAKSHGALIPDGWKWTNDSATNYKKLRSLFD